MIMADIGGEWGFEKSLLIKASVETVWPHIGDSVRLSRWWCPPPTVRITFAPVEGAPFREQYKDASYEYMLTGEVTAYEEPRLLAIRRVTSGRFGPADCVTIVLTPRGGQTAVTIAHSFEEILPERRGEARDFYADGWAFSLSLLEAEVSRFVRDA